jgi:hypothetical protein
MIIYKSRFLVSCLFTLLFFSATSHALDYYVSPTGSAAWEECTDINSPCSLHLANQNAQAGDTIFIRGGTYSVGQLDSSTEGINPQHSGTDINNRITYSAYPGEVAEFVGNYQYARAVYIVDQDWIHVTGFDPSNPTARNLKFSNMHHFLYIWSAVNEGGKGSDYCEVDHCEFTQSYNPVQTDYRGSTIYRNSQYNWIHHCTFSKYGFYLTNQDGGTSFELGWEAASDADNTGFNVIEDCEFYHGGHHVFGLHEQYNVVRNNHFHNEKWWFNEADGRYYGYRCFYVGGSTGSAYHGHNLIEGNRISHASVNRIPSNSGGAGLPLEQSNNIVRFNDIYANGIGGIFLSSGIGEECLANHIYNNTLLSNGYIETSPYPEGSTGNHSETSAFRRPMSLWTGGIYYPPTNLVGTAIKNNLMWKNMGGQKGWEQIVVQWEPEVCQSHPEACDSITIENNWVDTDGDPKFTNEGSYSSPTTADSDFAGCDPMSKTNPDLTLQPDSPVIDKGTFLTRANGSGADSTTLYVDDAKYFQPGWGNGAGGGAVVEADSIAVGSTMNTVQIRLIDYNTNKLTLSSPMTWADGAQVWLYKKSEGSTVLVGAAPDMGAHEYGSKPTPDGATPQKPAGLRLK